MSFGMLYDFGGVEGKEVKCDRKYLPKRGKVCGEKKYESYADCDKQCAGKRRIKCRSP